MSKNFDLEQSIFKCWHVVDDIEILYKNIMNSDLSKDEVANCLMGINSLYKLKFEELFDIFEQFTKEYYQHKNK